MRALLLLLLLANLLFAAWAYWVAPPRAVAGRATPSSPATHEIRLLREAQAPAAAAADGAGSGDLDLSQLACVSAGPYLERAAAQALVLRLQGLGFAARLREAREEVQVGHWVRVENLATPEDAANALAQLKAAGIADAYVVSEDATGAVVSLGVFAERERAAEVAAMAQGTGFEPRTIARLREADVFWLDIDRQASAGLPALEQLQDTDPERLPRVELRACPAPDAGGVTVQVPP